ncbi:universal stress protein [Nodosilinea sp. E11]|uniref:universal stress protein n=1 Tax=Nodosilinea sp. E11 TaxID=3037479 RepID=UPI00293463D7|nr:universal stress protein [Nodosilinea sp. E11]WOD38858.1 universal stress protein [Nodosilinea sp. E11]
MADQKILVALDQTSASNLAFDYALKLAQSNQSQIRLVYCLTVNPYENLGAMIDAGVGLHSSTEVQQKEEAAHLQRAQEAHMWLEQLRIAALDCGIEADFICETADPSRFICQVADDWNADLVVVGNSGKEGLKKLILGSVSQYVANHAPCKVVVVPSDHSSEVEFSTHLIS